MNELFRKLFGGFLIKETSDGPMVISRTITEAEFIVNKAARNGLPLNVQRISPDIVYFRPKVVLPLDRPAPAIKPK